MVTLADNPDLEITCVGANSAATSAMMKAGAARGARADEAVLARRGAVDRCVAAVRDAIGR